MKLDASEGTKTEQFFSQLCGNIFFRGFVFHSPKYRTQEGENEAGDVVIWLRHNLIVFEIISRKLGASPNTKSFVRKFGDKREQLRGDFDAYSNKNNSIEMKNEFGQKMVYPSNYFYKELFNGIVLIDAELPLENISYHTFESTVKNHFPIAFITKKLFTKLFAEIDTTWDLYLYLNDRKRFIEDVFYDNHAYFLNLNSEYELDLIGHYKINDNSFNLKQWKESEDKKFWLTYQNEFSRKIKLRNLDNEKTQVVDEMLEFVITKNLTNEQAIEHSWEIGILTRRARAGVFAEKIADAVKKVSAGERKDRHFAFENKLTGCWDVFYFNYGDDQYYFEERAKFLTKMKMVVEKTNNGFEHSVFCFAFRKSSIIASNNTFDYCFLWVEDSNIFPKITQEQYKEALKYFAGSTDRGPIREFPE